MPETPLPANRLPAVSPRTAAIPTASLLAAIRAIVGDRGLLTDAGDTAAYAEDWRRLYQGRTGAVVRPASPQELAAVVRLCSEAGTPLVPQGGNTSMVGGAVPAEDGSELVLSTSRLNRIRDLDPVDMTLTIEAGVTLKAAQLAAAEAGCLLPLSISSEGTAQIGGILAVNAGGNNTVRYGNARDLVLGLEVVLPDGSIWNGLRRLRKDNTGYCLRQLFVGSEGTLGIITAAVLKLAPQPKETAVALCGVPSSAAALTLFTRFQAHDAASITAFELMSALGTSFVLKHIPGAVLPLQTPAPFYVLVELASPRPDAGIRQMLETVLAQALEDGVVLDAAIAESDRAAGVAVAAARGAFRRPEARGRQHQERRVGPGFAGSRLYRPGHRRLRGADARGQGRPVRAHGRRQYSFQSRTAGRLGRGVVPRPGSCHHGRGERGGTRVRWQLLRRTWHRQTEALHDARLARRRRTGADAEDQGRDRSGRHHEPRQAAAITPAAFASTRQPDRAAGLSPHRQSW